MLSLMTFTTLAGALMPHPSSGGYVTLPPIEQTRPPSTSFQRTAVPELERLAIEAAHHFELPHWLFLKLIEVESGWDVNAVSPAGAIGLTQVIPDRAGVDVMQHLYNNRSVPDREALFDPHLNIAFGAKYLHLLYYRHFGDVEDESLRIALTLAAYNWGIGNVRRHLMADSLDEFTSKLHTYAPGETQRYVRRIASL
jgi:soluble lytic murein transglycosylase-like protein